MSDQLPMFGPTTSEDTANAISSPASESGVTPSDSQNGQTIRKSGQVRAPAHRSARQAKAKGLMTLATSGRIGLDSSESAALQSCLENRLMTLLDTAGSTLFKLTWKARRTPLGRRYLERAVLVLRTSGSGCTSVPTPAKADGERGSETMEHTVKFASLPTPMAGSPATDSYNAAGNSDYSRRIVELATVATPQACSSSGQDPEKRKAGGHAVNLQDQVTLAILATPRSEDSQCAGSHRGSPDTLHSQAQLAGSGPTATGGTAKTANTGQLNAGYSRWLMGLPPVWDDCGVMAMPSLRKLRKRS